jgi:uncharacterized protein (DUF58 family)
VKNQTIQIHPLRICGYVVLLLLDLALYSIFRSYFFLECALLLVLFPAISLGCVRKISQSISLEIGGEYKTLPGETVLWEVRLKNDSFFPAPDAAVLLSLSNIFHGTSEKLTLSMPVRAKGTVCFRMPVQLLDLGTFRVECDTCRIRDYLGMVSFVISCHAVGDIPVLPRKEGFDREEAAGYLSGLAETEESDKKGSDFSQVSDVREYIPGDRIRDIHWKLSAKEDSLMVKERVSTAGSEMVVLLFLSSVAAETQQVLTGGYQLICAFLEQKTDVSLLCWNESLYSFEEYSCHDREELDQAYCNIYEVPVSGRLQENQKQYMKNCYPFLGSYLLVGFENGEVGMVMQDNV